MLKHKGIVAFLIMPAAAVLWLIGWTLFWMSSYKERITPKQNSAQTESAGLTIAILVPEQRSTT